MEVPAKGTSPDFGNIKLILTLDRQYLRVADGVPLDVGGGAGEGSAQLLLDPLEDQGGVADEDTGIQVLTDPRVLEISEISELILFIFLHSLPLQCQRFYRN